MHFKIEEGCELFDKFSELREEMIKCHNASIDFIKENIGNDHPFVPDYVKGLAGGIIAVQFDEKPRGWVVWKNDHHPDMYKPHKSMKEVVDIREGIENLPLVEKSAVNELLGLEEEYGNKVLFHPAFGFRDDMVYVSLPDYVTPDKYKPIEGMVEITHSEYYDLSDSD